jgi:hypothetical protein
MLELFWGCFIGGILFTLVTVVIGDVIGNLMDGLFDFLRLDGPNYLEPMVLMGGITSFGGAGILLSEYTSIGALSSALLSFLTAVILSSFVFFFYVRPICYRASG